MENEKKIGRRRFVKEGALLVGGLAMAHRPVVEANDREPETKENNARGGERLAYQDTRGELLYNGIRLPETWPPRDLDSSSLKVQSVPYLVSRPEIVPIDVGRQLFVDDFLVEESTLRREFHQPVKYEGNPILAPETQLELNNGICPVACPFTDGAFFDGKEGIFKMWYQAGWFDGTAYVRSPDGVHWTRPSLDVVRGSNRILPDALDQRRDGATVWLDDGAENPRERYKMFVYTRAGKIGRGPLQWVGGWIFTSSDGVHWDCRGKTGFTRDNTCFFYNPFRKKWVFSHRSFYRRNGRRERTRSYWENSDFLDAVSGRDSWSGFEPVFWAGADELDTERDSYVIGERPQLYKLDAVGYESLMLGLFQIHYGPSNAVCAREGFPKLTELKVGFSRDGFYWDRANRDTFIGGTLNEEDWDRAYIHSTGGGCFVVGDKLYFCFGAFRGDKTNLHPDHAWNGMYANGATGLAVLRRDGFASMNGEAGGGVLTTRPVSFKGKYLFVNLDSDQGELRVEILDRDGVVLEPFSRRNCVPVSTDSTIRRIRWKEYPDLAEIRERPVRFRFYLTNGRLYSFWVASKESGASQGYMGAGGPGIPGNKDTVGIEGYEATQSSLEALRL